MRTHEEHAVSINIKTTAIIKMIAVFLVLGFLWLIRDILALLGVALFLAALMHPAARWGERKRIPKGVMVAGIYLTMFVLFAASFALILPTLIQQIGVLIQRVGAYIPMEDIASSLTAALTVISERMQDFQRLIQQNGSANAFSQGVDVLRQISQAASGFFGALTGVFGGLVGLVLVLVMAYYMVVEDREAIRLFHNLVPESYQERSAQILIQVEEKIGRWLSGQLVLSLIIGVLYYIGLLILGVESPLALSIFAAFVEFIPYLGPILGGIPIILVAFSESPVLALFALALVIIVQQLENHIIVPKVMQRALGLNPLACVVAVLVGAKLFGVVGVLLAVPVATALSVVLTELYRARQDRLHP